MNKKDVTIDEKYLRLRTLECGDCWEWLQSYTSSGIPLMPRTGNGAAKTVRSKVATDILKRKLPKGTLASNKCENKRCVRPSHVQLISRAQMLERSRRNTNEALRRAKITASRRASSTVMDEQTASTIAASDETLEVLAKRHNIHPSMVQKIKTGKAWAPQSSSIGMFSALIAANDHGRKRA